MSWLSEKLPVKGPDDRDRYVRRWWVILALLGGCCAITARTPGGRLYFLAFALWMLWPLVDDDDDDGRWW